jgi:dienelactone hydrolase
VADEATQDILVFEPDAEGSWPIVLAFHGINGNADHMAEIGKRLAGNGFVVFAPNYRTDLSTEQGIVNAVRDAECGYRYARSIASDYGGDLDRPLTFVGWSLGALYVIQTGLDEAIDPTGEYVSCFTEVARPEIIVAASGCYYEFAGKPFDLLEPTEWANEGADVIVAAGENDTVCPASQSQRAADELRTRGYHVRYVLLEGAGHFAPVFHRDRNGNMVLAPDEPAGDRIVQLVVDAIGDQ